MLFSEKGKRALRLLYPDRCCWCGKIIGFLPQCVHCRDRLEQIALPAADLQSDLWTNPSLCGVTACCYYENPVKQGVLRLKFKGARRLAEPFGEKMAKYVQAAFGEVAFDMAVPVPATARIRRRRGYQVTELLARRICQILEISLENGILVKEYETRPQHELPAQKRRANLVGAFGISAGADVRDKTVLLVDDVVTTGATLEECAKMLRLAGAAQVWAVTLAASTKIPLPQDAFTRSM